MSDRILLAIETSCDDTGVAIIKNGNILANVISTQTVHEQYGGVVPELASRDHQRNIVPAVTQAFKLANIEKNQLSAVAYTRGPGLLGSLLVGASFAKALALGLQVPIIEVNHMEAHILAHFIDEPRPLFPFLCLTVSGGHTQIVLVKDFFEMEVVGATQDDAVGEAFDKAAKMLEIPYPGGPLLDKIALAGDHTKYSFPEVDMQGLNYSFSGIKTSFLYFLRDQKKINPDFITENLPDICASMQACLVEILLKKLRRAAKEFGIKEVAIAGGVSANSWLRLKLQEEAVKYRWNIYIPAFEYCTDNAAMIAIAAHYKFVHGKFGSQKASPLPRWSLE